MTDIHDIKAIITTEKLITEQSHCICMLLESALFTSVTMAYRVLSARKTQQRYHDYNPYTAVHV